jgi:hypothetical protein
MADFVIIYATSISLGPMDEAYNSCGSTHGYDSSPNPFRTQESDSSKFKGCG